MREDNSPVEGGIILVKWLLLGSKSSNLPKVAQSTKKENHLCCGRIAGQILCVGVTSNMTFYYMY